VPGGSGGNPRAAAVTLLIAGLGPVGEQALAAAQDAVHEVVHAVHPGNDAGTVMESWEAIADPNAIAVPYDPKAQEDVQSAEQSAETR